MQVTTRRMEEVFPLLNICDGVAVSRKGALTVGYELTLPVAYTADEAAYDEMLEALASAVRILPQWSVVHRQDLYTRERWRGNEADASRSFLGRANTAHFTGRGYLTHRAFLYVTCASRNNIEKKGSSSGLFGMGDKSVIPSAEQFAEFRSKCSEFCGIMRNARIGMRELTYEDWMGTDSAPGLVQQVMMLGDRTRCMSNVQMTPSRVSVHDRTAVSYVLGETDSLPGEVATVSKVDALSTSSSQVTLSYGAKVGVMLDCEHIVNQYIIVPSQEEVLQHLDREKRKMFSGATNSADNRLNNQEISQYLDDAYRDNLFTVRANMNVIVWDEDDNLQAVKGLAAAALASMGCTHVYNNYNTPVLYYAAIPGCGFELGRENMMTMELRSALALGTYETFDTDLPGGMLRMVDRMRHIPVVLDTQRAAEAAGWIGNYNMFVLGGSGTGKSFFMNHYLRNCYDAGESIFLIDVGDSYEGLCGLISEESGGRDGAYLSWDRDHPFSFECFPRLGTWLKDGGGLNTDESCVAFFLSFLQTAYRPEKGWSTAAVTVLTQVVEDFVTWALGTGRDDIVFDDFFVWLNGTLAPKITYVAPALNPDGSARDESERRKDDVRNGYFIGTTHITPEIFDVDKFSLALKNYSRGGSYAFLLNDPRPRDLFTGRFTVFEVDRLSKDDRIFYSLCILCIISAMERKMRTAEGFKNIVIEEAWTAIANDTMAPYLRALWKTARKFSTSAVVVTQEVDDIISNAEIKTAIIDNSDTKILLDQSNHINSFDRLSELLSLSPMDRNLVLSINRNNDPAYRYREAFVKLGSKRSAVYATEVCAEEALAYESKKQEKQPLLDRARECGSMMTAVDETARRIRGREFERGLSEVSGMMARHAGESGAGQRLLNALREWLRGALGGKAA